MLCGILTNSIHFVIIVKVVIFAGMAITIVLVFFIITRIYLISFVLLNKVIVIIIVVIVFVLVVISNVNIN